MPPQLPAAHSDTPGAPDAARCSARGCRADASWLLRWRNPRLHDAARVKTWAACGEHRAPLEEFLRRREFLLGTDPAG